MKNALLTIVCLFITIHLFSQVKVGMVPIEANNVYLRLPQSTLFDSIIIDCPTAGKVFTRFEGNCISTPGDLIVLAASNYNDWNTNDGNTGVTVVDTTQAITCFAHSRIYEVEPGIHTFYAVGQNYVETNGSGYATINGQLTAMFMPDTLPDQAMSGIGISDCCWSWDTLFHVFPHTSIEALQAGKLLINFESTVYAGDVSAVQLGTSLQPLWSTVITPTPGVALTDEYPNNIMHQQIIDVDPGTYDVYGLLNLVNGDSSSTNNYLYGTLSAQFIPDDSPTNILKSNRFDDAISDLKVHLLTSVTFTNTELGKAWLHVTGSTNTSYDDHVRVRIVDEASPDSIISEITLQPVYESRDIMNFSLSGLKGVLPGEHTYYLLSVYDDAEIGNLQGDDLRGMFSVQFIADPIPSKVIDPSFNDSFTIYPNPTTGQFNIQSSSIGNDGPVEVTILNAAGQQINRQTVSNLSQYHGDLNKWVNSEYMVRIQQGNRVEIKSIVKSGN